MPAPTVKKIAGRLMAIALAAALAGAPQASLAMGGGRGGSNDIGFERGFQEGARNGSSRGDGPRGGAHQAGDRSGPAKGDAARGPMRIHEPAGANHAGDHFQDANFRDDRFGDPVVYGGPIPGGRRPDDPAFADHRLIGPVFDEVRRDWPVDFQFGPQMYGARDFPHCMRRDVYGDPYRAC